MRQPAARVRPRRSSNGRKATSPSGRSAASKADLSAALREVVKEIAASPYNGRVDLPRAGKTCAVHPDMVALVRVIVREAVVNAAAHAHPTGVEGRISVACTREASGAIAVTVTDDGVGLPENFNAEFDGNTGFRLMRASSERLGAGLTFKSTSLGLSVRLRMPNPTSTGVANGRGKSTHTNGASVEWAGLGTERGVQLLEGLPAAVYTTDAAGRITFYNAAAAELWGRRPK